MRTRYGVSPWIETFPDARRPAFETFRGDKTADIVIVGGGLTGCATAHALAAAGRRPIVLEAARIGQGTSGRNAGLLVTEPETSFRDLVQLHGLRATRVIVEGWKKAALDAAAFLGRAGIRADASPVDCVLAVTGDERQLRREHDGRVAASLESTWLDAKRLQQAIHLDGSAGLRVRGGFAVDPYKVCLGLVRAATKQRAAFFEKSPVEKVTFGAKDVEIVLKGATIRASAVVVTTGTCTKLFKPLQRHFTQRERYNVLTEPVAATVRRQLFDGKLALRLVRQPATRVRWATEHRLLLSGADQGETPVARRPPVLVQRTGQLMYELLTTYPAISGLRPEFGWEVAYGETADGLMYAGAHRNYPRHLFALGGASDSITEAFLAARLLTRAAQGASEKNDQVFGWTR
jgi:glycine/D-amino acid oxidase-like deaminating enzyme